MLSEASWLLKPQAIRQAKECIYLVQQKLDIRLKLSHPDFLYLLNEYAELTGSEELIVAVDKLISLADIKELKTSENLQDLKPDQELEGIIDINETVTYSGKTYPKYRNGLVFKGFYRGQPSYT